MYVDFFLYMRIKYYLFFFIVIGNESDKAILRVLILRNSLFLDETNHIHIYFLSLDFSMNPEEGTRTLN